MRIKSKDPELISHIGNFLNSYLPLVKFRDHDTIASYRFSLNIYLNYLNNKYGLTLMTLTAADFNQKNIADFKSWLVLERSNVATTVNHRIADLRGFCKYLSKNKLIDDTSYESIREVGDMKDERVIEFEWLTVEDTKLVLDQTAYSRDKVRDRFILSLAYESGARVNELLSLRVSDIHITSNKEIDVHFFGKGSKHRITPLSKEIYEQYERYCTLYHPNKEVDALLFYTVRNCEKSKMSNDNIERILKKCEAQAKKTNPDLPHLHSHLFRRTRAMHLLEAGVPITTISDWLGHSNLETTTFYAQVTQRMKRDALSKLADSDKSVFKSDSKFKYADNEEVLKRLCGLK